MLLFDFDKVNYFVNTNTEGIAVFYTVFIVLLIVTVTIYNVVKEKKRKQKQEYIEQKAKNRDQAFFTSPFFDEVRSLQNEYRDKFTSAEVCIKTNKKAYINQLNYGYSIVDGLIVPILEEKISKEIAAGAITLTKYGQQIRFISNKLRVYDHWKYYYDNYDDILNVIGINEKNNMIHSEYLERKDKIWLKFKDNYAETLTFKNQTFTKEDVDKRTILKYPKGYLQIMILGEGKIYNVIYRRYLSKGTIEWMAPYINEMVRRKTFADQQRRIMNDSLRFNVFKRDNYRCVICGSSSKNGAKLHVDHIIPVSRGGKTVLNNLQTLCEQCNIGKGIREM